jgi:endonuclease YncB( thermonuclease family)
VFEKRVELRCHKKDRFGREVCAVFVGMTDVGLEQIRA